jgi:hypothetical protein
VTSWPANGTTPETRPRSSTGRAQWPRLATAAAAAALACWAYTSTLLPGVDLGDTGAFQAAVLWPETSARAAYPLYYALARPLVRTVSPRNPAHGLNLFSAISAAAAVGLLTWLVAAVAHSTAAGMSAGLLLAFSFTFWTQAIIAEVYTLHLALVAAILVALYRYQVQPTTPRLAAILGVVALAFGNHLLTVLMLVPAGVFICLVHPRPLTLLRPRVLALGALIAALGALQYGGNLAASWSDVRGPHDWRDRLAAFWFDTTKSDWRATMVLGIGIAQLPERAAMWAWDARQQFGWPGLAAAIFGLARLWRHSRPWAMLVLFGYLVSAAFAFTYNVGDPHVFFLPAHFFTAFAAGSVLSISNAPSPRPDFRLPTPARRFRRAELGVGRQVLHRIAVILLFAYIAWRGWETWPAVDRSYDRRADTRLAALTAGLADHDAVLVASLDWQLENALLYWARYERIDLAWTRLADILLHFPFFVRDNHAIGRDVVLTPLAAADVAAAYGPAYTVEPELTPPPLAERLARIPPGTPYVAALLAPPQGHLDSNEALRAAVTALTGPGISLRMDAPYEIWAGLKGQPPQFHRVSSRPFLATISLGDEAVTIRLDGWLRFDAFRRGGFGRVLRGRKPVLIIERGLNVVWFEGAGRAAYAYPAGLYAPEPRYRID